MARHGEIKTEGCWVYRAGPPASKLTRAALGFDIQVLLPVAVDRALFRCHALASQRRAVQHSYASVPTRP
jgi:hypothetical protein